MGGTVHSQPPPLQLFSTPVPTPIFPFPLHHHSTSTTVATPVFPFHFFKPVSLNCHSMYCPFPLHHHFTPPPFHSTTIPLHHHSTPPQFHSTTIRPFHSSSTFCLFL